MNTVHQKTLFPEKNQFDEIEFENFCTTDKLFIPCVRNGVIKAVKKMEPYLQDQLSFKSNYSNLHELVIRCINNEVLESMSDKAINCTIDMRGNQRNIIYYNNYLFILKKDLSSKNDTKPTRIIDSQEADNHVIMIHYVVDDFWTGLKSLSLVYRKHNVIIYSYSIDLSESGVIFDAELIQDSIIEKAKPVFKKQIASKQNIE